MWIGSWYVVDWCEYDVCELFVVVFDCGVLVVCVVCVDLDDEW